MTRHTETKEMSHLHGAQASSNASSDEGRRVYVHEQALIRSGLRSSEHCDAMLTTAMTLYLPRRLEHALSDIAFLEDATLDPGTITHQVMKELEWRDVQTDYMRNVEINNPRPSGLISTTDAALACDLANSRPYGGLLRHDEVVVANCFYSNYYTLATTPAAGLRMFSDNATISDLDVNPPPDLRTVRPRAIRINRRHRADELTWLDLTVVRKAADDCLQLLRDALERHVGGRHSQRLNNHLASQATVHSTSLEHHLATQAKAITR